MPHIKDFYQFYQDRWQPSRSTSCLFPVFQTKYGDFQDSDVQFYIEGVSGFDSCNILDEFHHNQENELDCEPGNQTTTVEIVSTNAIHNILIIPTNVGKDIFREFYPNQNPQTNK